MPNNALTVEALEFEPQWLPRKGLYLPHGKLTPGTSAIMVSQWFFNLIQ